MTAHTGESQFRVGVQIVTAGTRGPHGRTSLAFTFGTSTDGGSLSIVAPSVPTFTLVGASAGSLTATASSVTTLTLTAA